MMRLDALKLDDLHGFLEYMDEAFCGWTRRLGGQEACNDDEAGNLIYGEAKGLVRWTLSRVYAIR